MEYIWFWLAILANIVTIISFLIQRSQITELKLQLNLMQLKLKQDNHGTWDNIWWNKVINWISEEWILGIIDKIKQFDISTKDWEHKALEFLVDNLSYQWRWNNLITQFIISLKNDNKLYFSKESQSKVDKQFSLYTSELGKLNKYRSS